LKKFKKQKYEEEKEVLSEISSNIEEDEEDKKS
jgi:hypothetical protein